MATIRKPLARLKRPGLAILTGTPWPLYPWILGPEGESTISFRISFLFVVHPEYLPRSVFVFWGILGFVLFRIISFWFWFRFDISFFLHVRKLVSFQFHSSRPRVTFSIPTP